MSSVVNTASASASASASAAASGNSTISASASGNSTASASATNSTTSSIPATAAPGYLEMVVPPQDGSTSYYKIASADYITFKWNMTSVLSMPQSLTLVATCTDNGNTYPVGPTNGTYNTIAGNATQIVWNPWEWAQMPNQPAFAQGSYTLSIWDQRGSTAGASAGLMSPYSGLKFGMYNPQSYTPLANWTCATCSGAMEMVRQPASLSILMSLLIMIISAFGLLRRL
ncbi:uncharacterized protein EHS24_004634 [Apiotrichum porosum]|uniref:DUF7137 domain-containing protein n=1 Tax=Apiotrichum porosum TaxID=105984 RepID=A0A427Y5N8_9TREE|nr:uncharacterized protein EHS24_004634 [Apiotrichum porosum]RSH86384.1 hypothetical protein EHS24_004634 [Apiotrichum porosum]